MIIRKSGKRSFAASVDWWIIICYLLLVFVGLMNIYASVRSGGASFLDFSSNSGKQFVWIMSAIVIASLILFVFPPSIYESVSTPAYVIVLILLVAVSFLGVKHNGSRSWFDFGPVAFQPAEVSKLTTSLLLATIMGKYGFKMNRIWDFLIVVAIIALPMGAILLEHETGSALVYAGFVFMLYREGLSGWIISFAAMAVLLFILTLVASPYVAVLVCAGIVSLCNCLSDEKVGRWFYIYLPVIILMAILPDVWRVFYEKFSVQAQPSPVPMRILLVGCALYLVITLIQAYHHKSGFLVASAIALVVGLALIFSVEFIFNDVLQPYQRLRIEVLLGITEDPSGIGYNVRQSMISIGSGGLVGKGFLHGTQTTFGFVPEQSTDFIFCTVGEEWGFVGCLAVIALYVTMIWRILRGAERSREPFTRIYGYCTACCLFMHLVINIGMTIGLMPVIGIPLPLLSYGGSSLWTFTILIFIFVALDRNEKKYF